MKKLYLVDVSSMFFRAFYAIPELKNSKGLPTNALYGFLSMTVKLLNQFKPKHMVYCLDRKEPSFRKDIDPRYKANRSAAPEELAVQIPWINKLTETLAIPQYDKKGYEADDVIGSLARWGEEKGFEVVIVSGDKDFAQLINENIKMYDPMKKKTVDVDFVNEKWGVSPEQFIDYLAIVGDSSDNIPGVKGIGPKGAQKLLAEYKNLDGIYDNTDKLKGSTQKKIVENKDEAYLSQKLVTIEKDLDFVESEADVALKQIDLVALEELFKELEFESFLSNFKKKETESTNDEGEAEEKEEEVFEDLGTVKSVKTNFKQGEGVLLLSSDRGVFVRNSSGKILSLPLEEEKLEVVGSEFSKLDLNFSGFGLKSLFRSLKIAEARVENDYKLICYSIKSDNWDFEKAYKEFCGKEPLDFESVDTLFKQHDELYKTVLEKIDGDSKKLYLEVELPLLHILLKMESEGIGLDKDILAKQSKHLEGIISKITDEVHAMVESPFNIASPKQLSKVLFEELGLSPIKKTKTGFSTNTDVLEKLKHEHEMPAKIIQFREASKLKSTYVDALPKLVNPKTGRLHTTFKQALTTTGRLSSVNPNLQNIPIKTELGRQIRKAFVAVPGNVLVSADYSQIELRILAHITEDPGLVDAFEKGHDIHTRTASEIFEISLSEVTSEQRRMAKAVNFGIAYGQGAYGLAETLNISRGEASKIIKDYFIKFAGVREYMDTTVERAKEKGYVETLLGRRRDLLELSSSNKMIQKFGERAAINAPIQGTAADLIKLAMITVADKVKSSLLLQVHDELIFSVKEENLETESRLIKEIMETVYPLSVPILVNVDSGKNWDEAH